MPSEGQLIAMLIIFAALVIGGLYVFIRVLVAVFRALDAASARRKARAAEPEVPVARVVKGSAPPS